MRLFLRRFWKLLSRTVSRDGSPCAQEGITGGDTRYSVRFLHFVITEPITTRQKVPQIDLLSTEIVFPSELRRKLAKLMTVLWQAQDIDIYIYIWSNKMKEE